MIFIMKFIVGFSAIATTVVLWALCRTRKLDEERWERHGKEQRGISGSDSK